MTEWDSKQCTFLPEPEADCSPTSSLGMSPSAPSSGMPTAARSCESDPPMDGSPACMCTRETFGCSVHPNTPVGWIASMRGSLASLLASPEIKKARQMSGENSLQKSFASLKSSDPNISFSKMYQDSPQADPRLAYVAGLIDGEGCLRIHRQSKAQTSTFTPVVQMNMSIKARIIRDQMLQMFGGNIYEIKAPNQKWSEQWQWRINGDAASDFVRMIYPYLMLKKQQADLILQLQHIKESQPIKKNGQRNWTQEAKESAARLKGQMHSLNQKGPDAHNADEGWYQEPDLFGIWNRFYGPWPAWGSMRDGVVYALPMLERPTSGIGGGAWLPTPTATAADRGGRGDLHSIATRGKLSRRKAWPTPSVCGNYNRKGASKTSGDGLATAARMWPTPLARDSRTVRGGARMKNSKGSEPLITQVAEAENRTTGALNPIWVEWLMGFPLGWTESRDWATRKSRCKRQSRGGC